MTERLDDLTLGISLAFVTDEQRSKSSLLYISLNFLCWQFEGRHIYQNRQYVSFGRLRKTFVIHECQRIYANGFPFLSHLFHLAVWLSFYLSLPSALSLRWFLLSVPYDSFLLIVSYGKSFVSILYFHGWAYNCSPALAWVCMFACVRRSTERRYRDGLFWYVVVLVQPLA